MIEGVILAFINFALVFVGLEIWRARRGQPAKRRFFAARLFLTSLVVTPLVLVACWQIMKARNFQFFGTMVTRVNTTKPVVALTFDDGFNPPYTDSVLSILEQHDVRATFFVTGQSVERFFPETQRLVQAGHQLGNHTYSHTPMVFQTPEFIRTEIERTDSLIRQVGYQGDIYFRAPNCKKLFLLPYYLEQTNRKHIIWDLEPETYPEIANDSSKIVAYVVDNARPGSIILLHTGNRLPYAESVKALPGIIDGLKRKGYQFKTVAELLAVGE